MNRLSHVVGWDDAPFARTHRGDVRIVGAVYAGLRLEGVLSGFVRRDGANATRALIDLTAGSRFGAHLQAVLLQGIALAGFNVVDVPALHRALGIPVVVVMRKPPDLEAVRAALLAKVRGGARKWALIQRAGPPQPLAGVMVQRAGISGADAAALIRRLAVHSAVPEPLRAAHMIAGGITPGGSRQRV